MNCFTGAVRLRDKQVVGAEGLRQRLGPQLGQQRVCHGVAGQPQDAAEAARIVEAQYLAVGQHEVDMIVLFHLVTGLHETQAAAHAQMHQHVAGGGLQQQVLAAPRDALNDQARQGLPQRGRDGPAQAGVAHDHGLDAHTFNPRRNAAAGGLHFGQFGHGAPWVHGRCAILQGTWQKVRACSPCPGSRNRGSTPAGMARYLLYLAFTKVQHNIEKQVLTRYGGNQSIASPVCVTGGMQPP